MKIEIFKIEEKNKKEIIEISKFFDSWYEWHKPYWSLKRIEKRLLYYAQCTSIPILFVATHNDEVVGTIGVLKYDDTKKYPKIYPFVANGFVKKEYRNKGIYKQLLSHVENYIFNLGYNKIYLRTDLVDFYEKLGWHYEQNIFLDNNTKEKLYSKTKPL